MEDTLHETYTSSDVLRATTPVVAPATPEPLMMDTDPAPRTLDDPGAPTYERRSVETFDEPRRFSFGASFFGWNVAAFWMLVLTGIVLGVLGASAYNTANTASGLSVLDVRNLTTGGFVGFLASMFVAYIIGGYVAGRLGRGAGAANGAGVAAWGVVAAIVLAIVGATLAARYNLGYYAQGFTIDWNALTGTTILGIVLSLAAMFLGGILGGILGARPYVQRTESTLERRGTYRRGRPL